MKKTFIYKSAVMLLSVFLLTSCSIGTNPESSHAVPSESQIDMNSTADGDDVYFTVHAAWYWSWNELYDYFEGSDQGGAACFDADQGETIKLFERDSTTEITDWQTMISDGMYVIKYNSSGDIINRFIINMVKDDLSTVSTPSTASGTDESSPSQSLESSQISDSSHTVSDNTIHTKIKILAPADTSFLKTAISAYEKIHPSIEIEMVEANSDKNCSIINFLKSKKGTAEFPDIVLIDQMDLTPLYLSGLTADLSTFGAETLKNLFTASCWDGVTNKTAIMALPLDGTVSCLVSNTDILSTSGVTVPDTFNDLLHISSKIKSTLSGVYPVGLSIDGSNRSDLSELFISVLWSNGGQFLTEDLKSAAFNSEAGTHAMENIIRLKRNGYISKDWTSSQLYAGQTALSFVQNTQYNNILGKSAKFNFSVSLIPQICEQNDTYSVLHMNVLAVTSTENSAQTKSAYDFAKFCTTSKDYQLNHSTRQSTIPSLIEAQTDPQFASDGWQCFITQLQKSKCRPSVQGSHAINGYIYHAITIFR